MMVVNKLLTNTVLAHKYDKVVWWNIWGKQFKSNVITMLQYGKAQKILNCSVTCGVSLPLNKNKNVPLNIA